MYLTFIIRCCKLDISIDDACTRNSNIDRTIFLESIDIKCKAVRRCLDVCILDDNGTIVIGKCVQSRSEVGTIQYHIVQGKIRVVLEQHFHNRRPLRDVNSSILESQFVPFLDMESLGLVPIGSNSRCNQSVCVACKVESDFVRHRLPFRSFSILIEFRSNLERISVYEDSDSRPLDRFGKGDCLSFFDRSECPYQIRI